MATAVLITPRLAAPWRALFARFRALRLARTRRQKVQQLAARVQWLEEYLPGLAEYGDDARRGRRGYDLMERGSALLVRWSERPGPGHDADLRKWHQDYERLYPGG